MILNRIKICRVDRYRHNNCWLLSCIALLFFLSTKSFAADEWHFCSKPFLPQELDTGIDFGATVGSTKTLIEAQKITASQQETLELSGGVQIQKGNVNISTENARYSVSDQHLTTSGSLRFEADQLITVGDTAEFDLKSRKGKISNVRFWLARTHLASPGSGMDRVLPATR